MVTCNYRFVLELSKPGGAPFGKVAVTPAAIDWEPARECVRFSAARQGLLRLDEPARMVTVQPLWDSKSGAPYLEGFRVSFSKNGAGEVSEDLPLAYLGGLASQASSHYVEKGILRTGEAFLYSAAAYPLPEEPSAQGVEASNEVGLVAMSCPKGELSGFLERSVPQGTLFAGDMPVFFPRCVLDEVACLTHASEGKETGGVLIGYLHKDMTEIFAEITAQIQAWGGEGNATHFIFTPQAWSDVRAAVKLRNLDEIQLGYWHSHPVRAWQDTNGACQQIKDYFSLEDRALLRAVFPRAYSVGLVCNDGRELSFSLFGWRHGLIQSRGFHIIGG